MSKYINNDNLLKLQHIASGRDIWGRVTTIADQQNALSALHRMERDEIADAQMREKMEEEKRKALVQEDIEYQKVGVEKAKQVVELFRIAADSGAIEPAQIMQVFTQLATNLLPGPREEVKLLLTQKEEKK